MRIIFIFAIMLLASAIGAQSDHWTTLDYKYSKGAVSPEYQLNYSIIIQESRDAKLIFTKGTSTSEHDFKISKKQLKKLNKALRKSKVFSISPDEMKSSEQIIGGPSRQLVITMWQSPDLDAKPPVIEVPAQVNEKCFNDVFSLYEVIEDLVPEKVWNKANSEK